MKSSTSCLTYSPSTKRRGSWRTRTVNSLSLSSSIFFWVASCPAVSLSKQRTSSLVYRLRILVCSVVSAVPMEATALSNPAWWRVMTSIFPSQRMKLGRLVFFARLMPYKFRRLLYTMVSVVFIYLGSDLSKTRPPKATTSPFTSMTGNMSRLRNLS